MTARPSIDAFDTTEAVLIPRPDLDAVDFEIHHDAASRADIAAANELAPQSPGDQAVAQLVAFLRALTDPRSHDLGIDVPMNVSSGLPLAEQAMPLDESAP